MRGGGRLGAAVVAVITATAAWVTAAAAQSSESPPITVPNLTHLTGAAEQTGTDIAATIENVSPGSSRPGGGVGSGGGESRGGGGASGDRANSSGGSGDTFTGPLYQGTPNPNCRFCDPDEFELGGFDGSPPAGPLAPAPGGGGGTGVPLPRSAAQIAYEIGQRTPLPAPDVRTSPPVGSDQLVNLPTWMWVEEWSPRTASASEGGLTVTVTATPRVVVWRMGDGSEVVCGQGSAWNPALREEQQSSDCTHTYQRSSAHQPGLAYFASATLVWDATWTASNGESGSLGSASRTSEFRMRVAEGQAVVIG